VKKALLVGINAYPTSPLRGCLNDVQDWHGLLTTAGKYPGDNVRAVCDDRATTQGIKDRLAWLREGITGPGDEVFFGYSGHGSQVRDRGELDELADHMDEILCPFDLDWDTKVITDDDLAAWIKTFPAGTKIIVALDSCHSGTGTRELRPPMENPHYRADRYLPPPVDIALRAGALSVTRDLAQDAPKRTRMGRGTGYRHTEWRKLRAAARKARTEARGWWGSWWWRRPYRPKPKPPVVVAPTVPQLGHVLISGCRSDQTSADAFINGRYNGAMTYYMVQAIRANPGKTLAEVHALGRQAILSNAYTQESQLEGPTTLLGAPVFA